MRVLRLPDRLSLHHRWICGRSLHNSAHILDLWWSAIRGWMAYCRPKECFCKSPQPVRTSCIRTTIHKRTQGIERIAVPADQYVSVGFMQLDRNKCSVLYIGGLVTSRIRISNHRPEMVFLRVIIKIGIPEMIRQSSNASLWETERFQILLAPNSNALRSKVRPHWGGIWVQK